MKEKKMKNVIKFIAVAQIIIAVLFMFYANQIDPGITKVSTKLAESCGYIEKIVKSHKEVYEKSAKNVVNLHKTLAGTKEKTQTVSKVLANCGKFLKTPPKKNSLKLFWTLSSMEELGSAMEATSKHLNDVSISIHKQAEILKGYEKNILPETQKGFDSVAASVNEAKTFLENLNTESQSNIKIVSLLAGIFFILNGITFWVIASILPATCKKEA